jgi:hypothetical protein
VQVVFRQPVRNVIGRRRSMAASLPVCLRSATAASRDVERPPAQAVFR